MVFAHGHLLRLRVADRMRRCAEEARGIAFQRRHWLAIPDGTRAKRIGLWHGLGNVVVTLLFAISWWLRRPEPANASGFAIGLEICAVLLALVTGWLGGELVDRLGVGVDDGANLNAPSSLSGRSARTSETKLRKAG